MVKRKMFLNISQIKKKYILWIFIIYTILVVGYGIKCRQGIDVFDSFSLRDDFPLPKYFTKPFPSVVFAYKKSFNNFSAEKKNYPHNTITVLTNSKAGAVNKKIFGNNLSGYDPSTYENCGKGYYGYTDFGAGIWDRKWEAPVDDVMALAKGIGIASVRFPGGCGTHHYDWKETIGKKRKHFWFGLDEFLEVAGLLKAEPVITVSYFTGEPSDAADMVEYLNAPDDGSNINGGVDWAAQRAKNGHLVPYGVKYFEIGNEVYHGDHQDIHRVTADAYARRYLDYYHQMKEVDPTVAIGAVFHTPSGNKTVAEKIQDNIDFGIIHTYTSPARGKGLAKWKPKDIFRYALASPMIKEQRQIQDLLDLLRVSAGRDLPLSITEFNGGFVQEKPVPYRHSLGNALLNAELLRVFIKPENHILMANYWQFNNSYWGMVANGFDGTYATLNKPYYKRPNYYVYEFYHNHFGEILIEMNIKSGGYSLWKEPPFAKLVGGPLRRKDGRFGDNVLSGTWRVRNFPGVDAKEEDGVLRIDFKEPKKFNYYHSNKNTRVEPNTYYLLSGYIKTENLMDDQGVCLEAQDARGWGQTHSAACTTKVTGTTDWQYVDALYRTLPDARSVNIIARRVGETGPLRGKAMFKDVQLQTWTPSDVLIVPYLSVNASKSDDGHKVYLMVINKNLEAPMTTTIELKDFVPASKAHAWVLNGPGVDATNEKDTDNVKVNHEKFKIWKKGDGIKSRFTFTFEPHSLTAIEIERN